uniref:Uncharacterized protein n=1 Tax=Anguilla anguilla TaxID=7936 RepID=A0A0E9PQK1_ANGAN
MYLRYESAQYIKSNYKGFFLVLGFWLSFLCRQLLPSILQEFFFHNLTT